MHRINLDETSQATANIPVDERTPSADNQLSSRKRVHPINLDTDTTMAKKKLQPILILSIVAIVAGIATGFGSYKLSANQGSSDEVITQPTTGSISKGDTFGSSNTEAFKDTALGYLEAGGIEGEGSHKLLRPGGEMQTVYLTSSVTDLDKLVGMDVKVWGETYKGQKAGWLMDVGRIEVVDPKGSKPTED